MIYFLSNQTSHQDINRCEMKDIIKYCKSKKVLAVDTETEGLFDHKNKIIMFQIGDKENQFIIDTRGQNISPLKFILEDKNIIKIFQNASFDYKFLRKEGIMTENIWDTQIAEMILTTGLDDRSVSLSTIAEKYLGINLDKTVRNQFVNLKGAPFTIKQIEYGAKDVEYLIDIRQAQLKKLEELDLLACLKLENRFVGVLSDMEYNGFYLDRERWLKLGEVNKEKLKEAKKELDNYVIDNEYTKFIDYQLDMFDNSLTCSISWDSPKQVIPFLQALGVNTEIKDKKTGELKHTCEEKNIGKFKKKFPFLNLYFNYKAIAKEISTYGVKFLSNINKYSGRVHSNYWQIISTGRMSSNNPNLQNIPAREDENGNQPFRECFRAEEGNILIVADYSQQEPRVTADKCQDPYLIDFILNGNGDSHSLISTMISEYLLGEHVEVSKKNNPIVPRYNSKIRDVGKMINLGLDYGKSAFSLKDDLNTSEEEAQKLIDIIKTKTPEKVKYFNRVYNESLKNGYILIDNVTKRKSFSEDFNKLKVYSDALEKMTKNKSDKSGFNWRDYYKLKGNIQRKTMNFPIQGTSGSMTKLAAIYLKEGLIKKEIYNKIKIVNIVHDEIVVETPKKYIKEVSELISSSMEKAGKVFCKTIPMKAEAVVSEFWKH